MNGPSKEYNTIIDKDNHHLYELNDDDKMYHHMYIEGWKITDEQHTGLMQYNQTHGIDYIPWLGHKKDVVAASFVDVPKEIMMKMQDKVDRPKILWDQIPVGKSQILPPASYSISALYVTASRKGQSLNKKFRILNMKDRGIAVMRVS